MADGPFELLVVSDSHGDVDSLSRVLAWAKKRQIRYFAFLGDGFPDLRRAFDRLSYYPSCCPVRGNGDYEPSVPFHRTMDVGGRRFFLTHGHLNAVQDTLDSLVFAAKASGAEAALFGHTHLPFVSEHRGVLVLNPGSSSRPRGGFAPSFATIACPVQGQLAVFFWNIDPMGVRAYSFARE